MNSLEHKTRPLWGALATHMVAVCLGAGLICWLGCGQAETPTTPKSQLAVEPPPDAGETAPPAQPTIAPAGPATAEQALTAREVLDAMVAAYKKAPSYDDRGYVEIRYQFGSQLPGDRLAYMVALAQPNKFRVMAYGGGVVCDGQQLWGAVMDAPDQVLQLEAPAQTTVESLFPSQNLFNAMAMGPTQTLSWLPLQLVLLLADDPLKTLLHQSEGPELIDPGTIDQHDCYRVRIQRPDGTGVFWIDKETFVLRRFEFPTVPLQTLIAERERVPRDEIQNVVLVAELKDAQFDGQIDPQVFQFQVPPEAKLVEDFMPDDIRWLGEKVPDFSFVDLDGSAITPDSLAGKIAVLDFWATWCNPCRVTLPDLEQVYQKYKDNEKIAFIAVSVDKPSVPDQQLRDTFSEIGVTVPIARYPDETAYKVLGVQAYPTSIILDADGVIQHYQGGGDRPGLGAMRLSARLEKALAGENLYEEMVQKYQETREAQEKQFDQMLQNCLKDDLYVFTAPEIPQAEIAERSEPKSLKLTQLWSCTELAAPGNILVTPRADQPPKILVLEGASSVAEIATQGNVVSVKPLGVPPQEPVFFLRSAAGADGKRYFVGSALGVQQVHLWDENFQLLTSFPEDAPQNRHAGISDVRIADFRGDGTLALAVSYFGVVGVQGVSLEGERVWANRSVIQSLRLAVLGPDAEGHRPLLCMNSPGDSPGTLVVLDWQGQSKAEFSLPNRDVAWLAADDLDGDGQSEICALTPVEGGHLEAVGLNLQGQILWSHPVPRGAHEHQIEAVTAGKLLPDQSAQWLLATADGTIHILDAEGKLIDAFAYGKVLTGVATAEWDGKRVLLVSSIQEGDAATGSVDAWQVEPAPTP